MYSGVHFFGRRRLLTIGEVWVTTKDHQISAQSITFFLAFFSLSPLHEVRDKFILRSLTYRYFLTLPKYIYTIPLRSLITRVGSVYRLSKCTSNRVICGWFLHFHYPGISIHYRMGMVRDWGSFRKKMSWKVAEKKLRVYGDGLLFSMLSSLVSSYVYVIFL
jgi:hypothetical protein